MGRDCGRAGANRSVKRFEIGKGAGADGGSGGGVFDARPDALGAGAGGGVPTVEAGLAATAGAVLAEVLLTLADLLVD
jgi:hypothetical protein